MFDYFDLGLFVYLDEAEKEAEEQENNNDFRSTETFPSTKEKEPHQKKIDD